MALTDAKLRTLTAPAKQMKLSDRDGLYLLLKPAKPADTAKPGKPKLVGYWRYDHRRMGKATTVSYGTWPRVSLADARAAHDAAWAQLKEGIDPTAAKKAVKSAKLDAARNTFAAVAVAWLARQTGAVSTMRHHRAYVAELVAVLGKLPIREVSSAAILKLLRKIEERAPATAHDVLRVAGWIMQSAIVDGLVEIDVTQPLRGKRGGLKQRVVTHRAAVIEPAKIGALVRAIDECSATPHVKAALRLLPLIACRSSELAGARWDEIDLEAATFTIPAARMKKRRDLVVPLSRQSVAIFRELEANKREDAVYVFAKPSDHKRHVAVSSLIAALHRAKPEGFEVTNHGFRASFTTTADEVLKADPEVMWFALGHAKDATKRAYNRSAYLDARRALAQSYADWLDEQKDPKGNVRSLALERAKRA